MGVVVVIRVAGNAIAKEAGKPARVLRKATCKVDQAGALALLPSVHCNGLTGHHAATEGSEDGIDYGASWERE